MGSVRVNYKFYNNFSKFLKSEQMKHLNGAKKITKTVLNKIQTAKLSNKDIDMIIGFDHADAVKALFRNDTVPVRKKYKVFLKKKFYDTEFQRNRYYSYASSYITSTFFSELKKLDDEKLVKKAQYKIIEKLQKRYADNIWTGVQIVKKYLNSYELDDCICDFAIYKYAILSYSLDTNFRYSFYYSNSSRQKLFSSFCKYFSKEVRKNSFLELLDLNNREISKALKILYECTLFLQSTGDTSESRQRMAIQLKSLILESMPEIFSKVAKHSKTVNDTLALFKDFVKLQEHYPSIITDKNLTDFLLAKDFGSPAFNSSTIEEKTFYKLWTFLKDNMKNPKQKKKTKMFTNIQCKICGKALNKDEKFLCSQCSNI